MANSFLMLLITLVLASFCSCSPPARHFHSQVVLITNSKGTKQHEGAQPEDGDEICYGVFLNENALLTAASCLYRDGRPIAASGGRVTLGFKPFDQNKIYWETQQIAELSLHPGYPSSSSSADDIAVLRLASGSTDSIRRRILLPCVNYSPPKEATLKVLSFGKIELGDELSPLFIGAFREETCEDSPDACVRSATDRDSECFGDNGVGLLTVDNTLIGIGKQFPKRRIAEAERRNCEGGVEKYTLLSDHKTFIDSQVGDYCIVDNLDNRSRNFYLY